MERTYRIPGILFAIIALLAATWAGLFRLGWTLPIVQPTLPLSHGPLMISGFLGTVISLERAVALRYRWLYVVPIISGLGGITLMINSTNSAGPILTALGSIGLCVIFAIILSHHWVSYTVIMALGALSWFVGNILWLSGRSIFQLIPWWMGFLILTIAGERLELGRLVKLSHWKRTIFHLAVAIIILGLLTNLFNLDVGMRIFGSGLILLAYWLFRNDIARYTVRQEGLSRFIAVCLLAGYVWLGFAGFTILYFGILPGGPIYDSYLHAVFLGFVISMIFRHAPIILPAIFNLPINYKSYFYFPLVLLHVSLFVRSIGGLGNFLWMRQWGGLINAIAILLYMFMVSPIPSRLSPQS